MSSALAARPQPKWQLVRALPLPKGMMALAGWEAGTEHWIRCQRPTDTTGEKPSGGLLITVAYVAFEWDLGKGLPFAVPASRVELLDVFSFDDDPTETPRQ